MSVSDAEARFVAGLRKSARSIAAATGLALVLSMLCAGAAQAAESPLASSAVVTVSSENIETAQTGAKAVDGVASGYPADSTNEWATVGGGAGSWIQLTWAQDVSLDEVVLYDRPNTDDQITGAVLTFSDGSAVEVGSLTNSGAGVSVAFAARAVSWVKLTITSVSSTTYNVGLAEFEAFGSSQPEGPSITLAPETVRGGFVAGDIGPDADADAAGALFSAATTYTGPRGDVGLRRSEWRSTEEAADFAETMREQAGGTLQKTGTVGVPPVGEYWYYDDEGQSTMVWTQGVTVGYATGAAANLQMFYIQLISAS